MQGALDAHEKGEENDVEETSKGAALDINGT